MSQEEAESAVEPKKRNRSGKVYFVLAEEVWRVKIGWANDPTGRLVNLQVASPVEVALLGMMDAADPYMMERALHRRFDHLRHRAEWFTLAPDLIAYIRKHRRDDPFHTSVADDMLAEWERRDTS